MADDFDELRARHEMPKRTVQIGDEVWVAAHRPARLAGRYGRVLTYEGADVLIDFGRRLVEWVPERDVMPAYGGEV
jgi:hypothetical protein